MLYRYQISSILLTLNIIRLTSAALSFTRITSTAPWDVRSELSLTQLREQVTFNTINNVTISGAINDYLLYAGRGLVDYLDDDVWHSTDMLSWQIVSGALVSSSSPYSMSPGSSQCQSTRSNKLVMLSGHGPGDYYEISIDGGSSWRRINDQAFQARAYSACVFDDTDRLIVIGGWLYSGDYDTVVNDVWLKDDALSSSPFTIVTNSANWNARDGHLTTIAYSSHLQRSLIYVIGGRQQNHRFSTGNTTGSNDIWVSSDSGASFIRLTSQAPFPARALGRLTATRSGVLIITGGESDQFNPPNIIYPDIWTSLDGLTWGVCASGSSLSYRPRRLHGALVDHNNYFWIAAGEDDAGKFNDVWKSEIRLDQLDDLVRECNVTNVPCGPGLRCWPSGTLCSPCIPSSSSTAAASGGSSSQLYSSSSISGATTTFSSSSNSFSSSSSGLAEAVELEGTSSSSSLNAGVIAGIVIACIVGLLLCWLLLVWCHTRRRQRMPSPRSELSSTRTQSATALHVATFPHLNAFSQSELDTPELHPQASSSLDSSACSTWPVSTSSMRGIEISEGGLR